MSNKKQKEQELPSTPNEVKYIHSSYSIQHLEGKILTFIDASISDPVQRKALKNLLSPMIWQWASDSDMSSYYKLEKVSVGTSCQ